ncbi:MAG: GDP-mannose 4,6-dehydratase [Kaiparowitsia implicata GSE-PSE-MK54-09C]|jgi:nucleoside-diphosphate-sugar epimerase|nr:GDP-mannose 4,6-dehydratase [Kaiparowitsia implicata GSE-PSE-MK54-09C]
MATSVVTGAAGFIGSNLTDALLQRGDRVIGIDHFNNYYESALKLRNLVLAEQHPNFQLIETDLESLNWATLLADMAFHLFFKAVLEGGAIRIYGDGQQTRDDTFVQDAIAANLTAATVPDAIGHVFNIGGGVVWCSLSDTMEAIVGQPILRQHVETAVGDARHTAADVTKAAQVLGYHPKVSLKDGLTQEWEWIQTLYCQHRVSLKNPQSPRAPARSGTSSR